MDVILGKESLLVLLSFFYFYYYPIMSEKTKKTKNIVVRRGTKVPREKSY